MKDKATSELKCLMDSVRINTQSSAGYESENPMMNDSQLDKVYKMMEDMGPTEVSIPNTSPRLTQLISKLIIPEPKYV